MFFWTNSAFLCLFSKWSCIFRHLLSAAPANLLTAFITLFIVLLNIYTIKCIIFFYLIEMRVRGVYIQIQSNFLLPFLFLSLTFFISISLSIFSTISIYFPLSFIPYFPFSPCFPLFFLLFCLKFRSPKSLVDYRPSPLPPAPGVGNSGIFTPLMRVCNSLNYTTFNVVFFFLQVLTQFIS